MNRLVLGAAIVCLFASQSFANGFAIPRLPDLSLWLPDPPPEADTTMRTGSMSETRELPKSTVAAHKSQYRVKETTKSP